MAYSTQRVTSDGSLVLLPISIAFFDRSEISVFFDGIVDAYPWEWVGSTEKTLAFSPAVPVGVEVLVKRNTDISEPRHVFSLGAAFTEQSIDEDIEQILHIAQEAKEGSGLAEIFNDLDFHGYKVINLTAGVNPGDAVNVQQLVVHDATIVGYRDETKGYRDDAIASAASASASKDASTAQATIATTQAGDAAASAAAALASKNAAASSATSASGSASAASASAGASAGSASTANTAASNATASATDALSYKTAAAASATAAASSAAAAASSAASINLPSMVGKAGQFLRANSSETAVEYVQNPGNPSGAVMYFAMNVAPAGWLKADGAVVSRTTYATLFSAIGTTYGLGDGSTTFTLPDLRGEFLRGWDDTRGIDPARAFGSAQGDMFKSHTHPNVGGTDGQQGGANKYAGNSTGATGATGGTETRPRNVAMLACIKI